MRPPSLTLRVLALVVDSPGQLDAAAIAERLLPWEPVPYTTAPARRLARASARAHRLDSLRRVKNALRELARRKDIRPASVALLEEFSRVALLQGGMAALREHGYLERDGVLVDQAAGRTFGTHAARIVHALLEHGPLRAGRLRSLTGGRCPSGAENGAWTEAYVRLVQACVVIPPAQRWPTLAGVQRVSRARLASQLPERTVRTVDVPALPGTAAPLPIAS